MSKKLMKKIAREFHRIPDLSTWLAADLARTSGVRAILDTGDDGRLCLELRVNAAGGGDTLDAVPLDRAMRGFLRRMNNRGWDDEEMTVLIADMQEALAILMRYAKRNKWSPAQSPK